MRVFALLDRVLKNKCQKQRSADGGWRGAIRDGCLGSKQGWLRLALFHSLQWLLTRAPRAAFCAAAFLGVSAVSRACGVVNHAPGSPTKIPARMMRGEIPRCLLPRASAMKQSAGTY